MSLADGLKSLYRDVQTRTVAGLRTVQEQAAALQRQAASQLASVQVALSTPKAPPPASPYVTQTLADARAAVSSGVQAVTTNISQIVQAHTPIVQAVTRDAGRAVQAVPATVRDAPAAAAAGVGQIAQAHTPIVQAATRDAARAVQSAPSAVRSAPTGIQSSFRQVTQAHSPIVQGIDLATQRKAAAQADLIRRAGPARTFEQGLTYPIYAAGQDVNRRYQQFIRDTEPYRRKTNILQLHPGLYELGEGFARSPGLALEGLAFVPPALERVGQLTWKEPRKLPGSLSQFAGEQIEGLRAGYRANPWGTAGEILGTAVIGAAIGGAARGRVPGGRGPGPAPSSVVRAPRPRRGHRFSALEFGYRTELVTEPRPKLSSGRSDGRPASSRYVESRMAEREKYARSRSGSQTVSKASPALGRPQTPIWSFSPLVAWEPTTTHQPAELAQPLTVVVDDPTPPSRVQQIVDGSPPPSRSQGAAGSGGGGGPSILTLSAVPPPSAPSQTLQTSPPPPPREGMLSLLTITPPRRDPGAERNRPPPRTPPPTPIWSFAPTPPPVAERRIRRQPPDEPAPRRKPRKKKRGSSDHWEFAPVASTEEMVYMIFGPPSAAFQQAGARDRSYLSFDPPAGSGPRQSYLVFDPPQPDQPTRAGERRPRKPRKKSARKKRHK